MEFLAVSEETLRRAAAVLAGGGLVAFPTETVYGLGADAFNPAALAKVFAAKGRPRFDPLIVHIASRRTLEKIADLSLLDGPAREKISVLAETLWPGPLTMILPKQKAVPDLATSGLATVAVRFPAHPAALRLIELSGGAIAAPSANPFGYLSPTRASHVRNQLGDKVDIILDGGPASVGVESTVIDMCRQRPRILRPGGVPAEKIEALIGTIDSSSDHAAGGDAIRGDTVTGGDVYANGGSQEAVSDERENAAACASPGMLKSHYAPRTPLAVFSREEILSLPDSVEGNGVAAFLFFDGAARDAWQVGKNPIHATVKTLSESGNTLEAAAHLFEYLHELDASGIARINAQCAPEQGLGAAINDRLRRGSAG
jgi:L-threonylcarbamoyladenylate synthase